MIEQILSDVAMTSDGAFSAICLRYFNPIGAHSSGLIGEDFEKVPQNLMPYIAKVANGHLPYLNVFGTDYDTPDGTAIRDYTHINDLVKGHIAALAAQTRKENQIRRFQPINLGGGGGASVFEIIAAFEKVSGFKIPTKHCDRRTGDVTKTCAIPDLALELLNWKAEKSIEDACRDQWSWV